MSFDQTTHRWSSDQNPNWRFCLDCKLDYLTHSGRYMNHRERPCAAGVGEAGAA